MWHIRKLMDQVLKKCVSKKCFNPITNFKGKVSAIISICAFIEVAILQILSVYIFTILYVHK